MGRYGIGGKDNSYYREEVVVLESRIVERHCVLLGVIDIYRWGGFRKPWVCQALASCWT